MHTEGRAGHVASTAIVVALALAIPMMAYAAQAGQQEDVRETSELMSVADVNDRPLSGADIAAIEAERVAQEQAAAEAEAEAAEAAQEAEWYDYGYEDYGYSEWNGTGGYSAPENGSGLTREGGVNYYNGRTETYYSSNVLYHYRTPEWTLDDEGFYRTDEGYYVVAASDMPEGSLLEGSKGVCIVLDSGCDAGVSDYYVGW